MRHHKTCRHVEIVGMKCWALKWSFHLNAVGYSRANNLSCLFGSCFPLNMPFSLLVPSNGAKSRVQSEMLDRKQKIFTCKYVCMLRLHAVYYMTCTNVGMCCLAKPTLVCAHTMARDSPSHSTYHSSKAIFVYAKPEKKKYLQPCKVPALFGSIFSMWELK